MVAADGDEDEVNNLNINIVLDQWSETPRSFMFTRPIHRTISAQQSLWHDVIFDCTDALFSDCTARQCDDCFMNGLQVLVMYQHSMSDEESRKYFMFNDKETLSVKGDNVITGGVTGTQNPALRDIRAEWLGLSNTFDGTFNVNPAQQQWVLWLENKIDLKEFLTHPFFDSFWVGVSAPIHFVRNNITIRQNITTPSTTLIPDIITALNQPDWHYAKFDPARQSNSGLSELIFKLGTRFLNHDFFQLGMYSGVLIPIKGGQSAEYVFSPFLGNNNHYAFLSGGTLQLPLNCPDNFLIAWFIEMENIYLFRHNEYRTVDLRFKPWSRYLQFNNIEGLTNIPGANVLTRKFHVHPYNLFDLSTGLRYQYHGLEVEIGYEFWARGNERLTIYEESKFPDNFYGIAGDGTLVPGTNIAATADNSTIANKASNDVDADGNPIFKPITMSDLDLISGGAQNGMSNRLFIDLGFHNMCSCFELFVGAGAFYEIAQRGSLLNNWGVWFKFGGAV